jgi:hypothetical protein
MTCRPSASASAVAAPLPGRLMPGPATDESRLATTSTVADGSPRSWSTHRFLPSANILEPTAAMRPKGTCMHECMYVYVCVCVSLSVYASINVLVCVCVSLILYLSVSVNVGGGPHRAAWVATAPATATVTLAPGKSVSVCPTSLLTSSTGTAASASRAGAYLPHEWDAMDGHSARSMDVRSVALKANGAGPTKSTAL